MLSKQKEAEIIAELINANKNLKKENYSNFLRNQADINEKNTYIANKCKENLRAIIEDLEKQKKLGEINEDEFSKQIEIETNLHSKYNFIGLDIIPESSKNIFVVALLRLMQKGFITKKQFFISVNLRIDIDDIEPEEIDVIIPDEEKSKDGESILRYLLEEGIIPEPRYDEILNLQQTNSSAFADQIEKLKNEIFPKTIIPDILDYVKFIEKIIINNKQEECFNDLYRKIEGKFRANLINKRAIDNLPKVPNTKIVIEKPEVKKNSYEISYQTLLILSKLCPIKPEKFNIGINNHRSLSLEAFSAVFQNSPMHSGKQSEGGDYIDLINYFIEKAIVEKCKILNQNENHYLKYSEERMGPSLWSVSSIFATSNRTKKVLVKEPEPKFISLKMWDKFILNINNLKQLMAQGQHITHFKLTFKTRNQSKPNEKRVQEILLGLIKANEINYNEANLSPISINSKKPKESPKDDLRPSDLVERIFHAAFS